MDSNSNETTNNRKKVITSFRHAYAVHSSLAKMWRRRLVKNYKLPAKRLNSATNNEAKILIDSIKMLYPKAFETRRAGIG